MYVIFPADEVVYLSYGRLIYVPSAPRTSTQQDPPPIPEPLPCSGHSTGSYTTCPSPSIPSTSSSRSFRSTASAPYANGLSDSEHNPQKKPRKLDTLQVPKEVRNKRLSYSDFLPVHKCLQGDLARKGKSSKVDFDDLFRREISLEPPSPGNRRLSSPEKSPVKKKTFFGSSKAEPKPKRTSEFGFSMATGESAIKDLTHPFYNEHLKGHNAVTFKLIRTVSDFTQQLSQMYEQHAEELQHLVANFRKRNGELRKERPACPSSLFHTWETLLQEVEIDSQALGDIASILGRQVSRPLLEKSFYRKIQSRKVFTHRESYETIITKTEEKLSKCRQEYKTAYLLYLAAPSTETLSAYFNTHNAYVQQLHATNGMLDEYGKETLPQLLQELEEIYTDLCSTLSEAVLQGAEVVSARAMEQCKRYEGLVSQCRTVNGSGDLAHLGRSLPAPQGRAPIMKRPFVPPQPPPPPENEEDGPTLQNENIPPPLKDELVIDRLSAVQVKPSHDALRKEAADLEAQIRQIQDALDTLVRMQQRSLEASLFNKANEIQEDISMKRFDLRVAQIHLRAIHFQKELFSNKLDSGDSGRERKMSNASQGSMKTKWLKAFKSLKTPPPETEKKNGSAATRELLKGDPDAHNFQEYTYKKITPCDVCSQVLRGHTRQGLKCRICKMNVHVDCQEKASKCQAKARLLRRQKSTSEIETRIPDTTADEESIGIDERYSGMPTMNRQLSVREVVRTPVVPTVNAIESQEVDLIYQVLKQAGEISNSKGRAETPVVGITVDRGATPSGSGQSLNRKLAAPAQPPRSQGSSLCVINPAPCSTSSDRRPVVQGTSSAEGSMRRRIFAGMKSLTGFGSRSRHGSPGHRSISLPEKRKSTDASGTRPFGQPLMLGPQFENGNGGFDDSLPPTPAPPSPSPSKGKNSNPLKKATKPKK